VRVSRIIFHHCDRDAFERLHLQKDRAFAIYPIFRSRFELPIHVQPEMFRVDLIRDEHDEVKGVRRRTRLLYLHNNAPWLVRKVHFFFCTS
jgi:hypothetical protein